MQSLHESGNLDKNNKEMIGDDMVISYKVDTNFFEIPLNKGFQSGKPIEWE